MRKTMQLLVGSIPITTLAIPAVFVVAFLVAVVDGHVSSRPCPRCGQRVVKGHLDCSSCGFDFRTVGR